MWGLESARAIRGQRLAGSSSDSFSQQEATAQGPIGQSKHVVVIANGRAAAERCEAFRRQGYPHRCVHDAVFDQFDQHTGPGRVRDDAATSGAAQSVDIPGWLGWLRSAGRLWKGKGTGMEPQQGLQQQQQHAGASDPDCVASGAVSLWDMNDEDTEEEEGSSSINSSTHGSTSSSSDGRANTLNSSNSVPSTIHSSIHGITSTSMQGKGSSHRSSGIKPWEAQPQRWHGHQHAGSQQEQEQGPQKGDIKRMGRPADSPLKQAMAMQRKLMWAREALKLGVSVLWLVSVWRV